MGEPCPFCNERMFPIQAQWNHRKQPVAPHPTKVPWSVAEIAYGVYSDRYGRDQSLERLAERGGFAVQEMDDFLPDWRDRCERHGRRAPVEIDREGMLRAMYAANESWDEDGERTLTEAHADAAIAYVNEKLEGKG